MLTCSRCGLDNPETRLFCQNCGLGLEIVEGSGVSGRDAPVGDFYFAGLVGGALSLPLSGALFLGLMEWLKAPEDPVSAAQVLTFYLSRIMPLLFVLGCATGTAWRANRRGFGASYGRSFLGAAWVWALGSMLASWGGEIALLAACLLSPLAAGRAGVGLFRPWLPLSRLLWLTAGTVAVSGLLSLKSPSLYKPSLLDGAGKKILLAHGGEGWVLQAGTSPTRLGALPANSIAVAWIEGSPWALTTDCRLVGLGNPKREEQHLFQSNCLKALRIGDAIFAQTGKGILRWNPAVGSSVLWATERGAVLWMQPGELAEDLLVQINRNDILSANPGGKTKMYRGAALPLSARTAINRSGDQACSVMGQSLYCHHLPGGRWEERGTGLRVREIRGIAFLGGQLVVGSERGLYLGQGTANHPFRRQIADEFMEVRAIDGGVVAVGTLGMVHLDPRGRWNQLDYPKGAE